MEDLTLTKSPSEGVWARPAFWLQNSDKWRKCERIMQFQCDKSRNRRITNQIVQDLRHLPGLAQTFFFALESLIIIHVRWPPTKSETR